MDESKAAASADRLIRRTSSARSKRPHTPKTCESYDYDLFESQVRLRHQAEHNKKTTEAVTEAKRWGLTILVSIATALVAVLITWATRRLTQFKYDTVQPYLTPITFSPSPSPSPSPSTFSTLSTTTVSNHSSIDSSLPAIHGWFVLLLFNVFLVTTAAIIVTYFAPVSGGSGIPEIKCLLNGIKIPEVVRIKTLFAKAVGAVMAVSGGLPVGKEGPMIHIGAVVGAGLSQGKSTTFGVDTGFSKMSVFRNDREKSDFVTCGTAAGVAAAFGAPIGAVLFCLEEGTSWWRPSLTWRTFFSAMGATLILDLFLSQVNGSVDFGYFSQPGMLSFGSFILDDQQKPYNIVELPFFGLIGIIGGILGAGFNALNTMVSIHRLKMKNSGRKRCSVLHCILIACVITTTNVVTSYVGRGDCVEIGQCQNGTTVNGTQSTFDWENGTVRFLCPEGSFSPVATMSFGSSEVAIKYLFHSSPVDHCGPSVQSMVWYGIAYFLMACFVYGLPIPSGLFVPGILSGAIYGRVAGTALVSLLSFQRHASIGTYALVGAASMLGGISRLCIALTVILVECTGDIQLTVPLTVAVLFARWSANLFNEGLYDIHIELNKFPFLPYAPPRETSTLRVSSVMTRDPMVLRPIERVGTIVDLLSGTSHNAFPVVTYREKTSSRSAAAGTGAGASVSSPFAPPASSTSRVSRGSSYGTLGGGGTAGGGSSSSSGQDMSVGRRLHGMVLRKHLCVLLSEQCKSEVLLPSHQFVESANRFTVTRVRVRNNARAGAGRGFEAAGSETMTGRETTGGETTGGETTGGETTGGETTGGEEDEDDDDDDHDETKHKTTSSATKNGSNSGRRPTAERTVAFASSTLPAAARSVYRDLAGLPRARDYASDYPTNRRRPLMLNFKDGVLSWEALESLYPRYLPFDKNLTEAERNCWVDLRPYMNEAPNVVSEQSVVTQAYQQFRHLGLRHLVVIDDDNDVVGMVTRHELIPEKIIQLAETEAKYEGDRNVPLWTPTPRHRLRMYSGKF